MEGVGKKKKKGERRYAAVGSRYHGGFGFAYFFLPSYLCNSKCCYPYFPSLFSFSVKGLVSDGPGGLSIYIQTYIHITYITYIHTHSHTHGMLRTDSNQTAVRITWEANISRWIAD